MKSHGLKIVIASGALLIGLHQVAFPYWRLEENTPDMRWYISSFIFGAVAAFVPRLQRPAAATLCGLAVLATIVLLMPVVRHALFGIEISRYLMNKYLLFSPLWAVFIITQIEGNGWIGGMLRSPVMEALGKWSYAIYLIHWYFLGTVGSLVENRLLAAIVSCALAVLSGCCLYRLVELPSAGCRDFLWRKMTPRSIRFAL